MVYRLTFIVFLTLVFSLSGYTQLCTGSLGDPMVNINFGAGRISQVPLPTVSTNYIYQSIDCPNDGYYTITNTTSACFGNTWHSLTEDHTPNDVDGNMMLVNASFDPGLFYLDTVRNLCGSTSYEFSAWIISVIKSPSCGGNSNKPNITFNIETTTGTVLKTYNTGDIPNLSTPVWVQYGFFFSLPSGVSDVVLRMVNNAQGGCGNDLALDDITFRPCGPKIDIDFSAFSNTNGIAKICLPGTNTITFTGAVPPNFTNPGFQWQASTDNGVTWNDIVGATGLNFTKNFTDTGNYKFRLSVADASNINILRCRVSSNTLTVLVDSFPVPKAANTGPVCEGKSVTLNATSGGAKYLWSGPLGFSSGENNHVINSSSLANSGKYYVTISSIYGCNALDSTIVSINPIPVANAGKDANICSGTGKFLQATGGAGYSWNPSAGLSDVNISNPFANPEVTTQYIVNVVNQYNCFSADTVTVNVVKTVVANAGPDKSILEGASVQLDASITGDIDKFNWSPAFEISNVNSLKPIVNPAEDATFILTAFSKGECNSSSDQVFVKVYKNIIVPNAFSPNGDGINDVWNIVLINTYPESTVDVFNRYGQLIYSSRGYTTPWDGRYNGKELPIGVYYYIIDRKHDLPINTGSVSIIR